MGSLDYLNLVIADFYYFAVGEGGGDFWRVINFIT